MTRSLESRQKAFANSCREQEQNLAQTLEALLEQSRKIWQNYQDSAKNSAEELHSWVEQHNATATQIQQQHLESAQSRVVELCGDTRTRIDDIGKTIEGVATELSQGRAAFTGMLDALRDERTQIDSNCDSIVQKAL